MATLRLFQYTTMSKERPAFDKAGNTGFQHLRNAAMFSLQGLREAVKRESAFRQELGLLAILTPLAVWIATDLLSFVLLISTALLVLVVELLNSGIEAAIDRVGTEYHDLAKLGKDYGSAAVMLALVIAAMVWGALLLQKVGVAP